MKTFVEEAASGVNERFSAFVRSKGGIPEVARELSISEQVLRYIAKGRNKPSSDTLAAMKRRYPDFSIDHLLTGEPPVEIVREQQSSEPVRGTDEELVREVRLLREEIRKKDEELRRVKRAYKAAVDALDFKSVSNGASGYDLFMSPAKAKRKLLNLVTAEATD